MQPQGPISFKLTKRKPMEGILLPNKFFHKFPTYVSSVSQRRVCYFLIVPSPLVCAVNYAIQYLGTPLKTNTHTPNCTTMEISGRESLWRLLSLLSFCDYAMLDCIPCVWFLPKIVCFWNCTVTQCLLAVQFLLSITRKSFDAPRAL